MQYLVNFLSRNGGKHVVGEGLSIADLCLWDIVDLHMRIYGEQIKETVSAYDRMVSRCSVQLLISTP